MHYSGLSSTTTRPRRDRRPSYKILANAESRRGAPALRRRFERQSQKATRVEVVVPTLRQIRDAHIKPRRETIDRPTDGEQNSQEQPPTPQIKSEEDDVKTYFLLQASIKVEVKQEEIVSENVVRDRLALIGYDTLDIKVPRAVIDATMTREFASRVWGGSPQATFPKIGKAFTHGLDDFMYISLLYDPHAPRWPGSPGLLFRFKDDGKEWPKIMRVVVRLREHAWQYMGQYKLTAAPSLTPDEWNAQSLKIKRKWANKLSESKYDGGLKAKITLRKRLGRDPTQQEMEAALQSNERFLASADEILQACGEGREVARVWCMKCVDYDVDFQRRIAARVRGLVNSFGGI